jgi:GDP-4-dehydro-6-deoxy-D-mannose reductase
MRVLVTGGTGFVGPHLASELRRMGHIVDVPEYPQFDVTKPDTIAEAFGTRPDAVIHLAAIAYPATAKSDPERAFEVAVGGTINVLERACANPAPPFVLVVSSSEVYGKPAPESLPLTETSPLRPSSVYGLAKVAQESIALAYFATRDLPGAVARPFNHSGSGQTTQYVIPALASRILDAKSAGRTEVKVGNLDVSRDILHVGDVVRAYRLLIETGAAGIDQVHGRTFNIATGSSASIRSIFNRICQLADAPMLPVPDPALIRSNDVADVRGDYARIEAAVGWRPELSLDDVLGDVLASVRTATAIVQ